MRAMQFVRYGMIQTLPPAENGTHRLRLGAVRWNRPKTSHEVSACLDFNARRWVVGIEVWSSGYGKTEYFFRFLPTVALRLHVKTSWGGRFC